jgi:hypothetical protein
LEVAEASRAFKRAVPVGGAAYQVQDAAPPLSHQPPPLDAIPPQAVDPVRQEYERVVQRRARLQELMRLEEEEDMLMRQLHASSGQAAGAAVELPHTASRSPLELPP